MLTKVTAYNPLTTDLDPLVFNVINRPETDLFEVRNIDGLGAVKADVNTTPLGSVDKAVFTGASFGGRNIVLTLGLDPDWDEWTVSRLRRLLDRYFMPKFQTRLVFETMEYSPVEITGYVESNEPNMFSKDPEHQISIICPDPDFTSVAPIVIYGQTDMDPLDVDYQGNLETGINVIVRNSEINPDPYGVGIYISNAWQNPNPQTFVVQNGIDNPLPFSSGHEFMMSSLTGHKFVKMTGLPEVNLLQKIEEGYNGWKWPTFKPGINQFQVVITSAAHDWVLTYFEHFGSL